MSDIIDLAAERNRREEPDPEFMTKDAYGRTLYTFLLSYEHEGRQYSTKLVAYDMDDAEAKVASMRLSLKLDGQMYRSIPLP